MAESTGEGVKNVKQQNFKFKMTKRLFECNLFTFCILCFTFYISSCSVQKQIAKSATQLVIKDSSLTTAHVGISIYEPAANKYWFNYQGDHYFVPASNTKIPTCYAAMKYLGDSLVGLEYSIENDTIIVIRGTGDPSFLHPDFKIQQVVQLLKRFKFISIESRNFQEFLGSGWSWNDYKESYMAQRSDLPIYGNIVSFRWMDKRNFSISPNFFRKQATVYSKEFDKGIEIDKPWGLNNFSVSDGTQKFISIPFTPDIVTIASLLRDTIKTDVTPNLLPDVFFRFNKIHSQPTDSLLKPMMHHSDNFFAEQSLLMVSNERIGYMSDEKIIDTLLKTDFKDLLQKPRWVDGSGLSRYNLFSPQDFVSILNKIKNEFGMDRIKNILPTGNEGTLEGRFIADSNYIFAKTGTLSGVVALSGYLYTKKNKLLIFSVLVNNHQALATAVRKAVEKFIEGIRNKY